MQRLVLFDLDDTLIDRGAAFRAWAAEFVADRALGEDALTWLVLADAHDCGPRDRFFAGVREQFGLPVSAGELWEQYRRRMPELVSCSPEDLRALERLRAAGWRTGIVTNGATDNQLGKIRRTGLDSLVDGWCISEEAGIRKPDPEIFRLAARRCGAQSADGGWMVGDSLQADVAGGHAAGLRTAWLQPRKGPWTVEGQAPHITVDSVAQAAELLLAAG